jgi:carboxyl-terminal processing protease
MRSPGQNFLKRTLLVALSLLVLVFICSESGTTRARAARSNDAATTLTREGRLAVFDDAWQTINDRYYDSRFRGIDWMLQRSIFRTQAAEAEDAKELYTVLRNLVATLNDVHTRVFPPEEKFEWWNPRFISIGLTVREVDGLPTVVRVEKDSSPAKAGIREGDVIEQIDGTSALSLIGNRLIARHATVDRPASRMRVFASIFEGDARTSVDLEWRTRTGELRSGRFERHWYGRQLGLRVRRQGTVVVAEIDAFTPTIALDFTRQLKRRLRGARGVIVDLRGNGGGEAEAMADVASSFLHEGTALGTFTDRWGLSFSIRTRERSLLAPEMITRTDLPVVVLVSEKTSSAAEIFAAAMRSAGRATILGTETCGCVLAIRNQHKLPDGGVLDVSELDYRTSAGLRLEENGIIPDVTITTARQDLYSRVDRALQTALHRLSRSSR